MTEEGCIIIKNCVSSSSSPKCVPLLYISKLSKGWMSQSVVLETTSVNTAEKGAMKMVGKGQGDVKCGAPTDHHCQAHKSILRTMKQ